MSQHPRPPGTVAARVQALQEFQTVDDLAPRFPRPPGPLQQRRDARRKESDANLGSPGSHLSRDGTESTRSETRVPPGAFDSKPPPPHPLTEGHGDNRLPSHQVALRPSTSLAARSQDFPDSLGPLAKAKSVRRNRSIETLREEPKLDLSAMRARLRSHGEKKGPAPEPATAKGAQPEQPLAMSDIHDMIDYVKSSIEHQAAHDAGEVDSVLRADGELPSPSTIRRWKSARVVRPSLDASLHVSVHHRPDQQQATTTDYGLPGRLQKQPSTSSAQLAAIKSLSPIKAKAAIFESMDPRPQEAHPQRQLHGRRLSKSGAEQEAVQRREEDSSQVGRRLSVYRQRQESTSTKMTASFDTARQCDEQECAKEAKEGPASPVAEVMPRWRAFSKGSFAVPQATEDSVMAMAEKDMHSQPSRPSLVQSRIQGLLASSNKGQQHDQPLNLRLTPSAARDREPESGDNAASTPGALEHDRLAFLQASAEEQLKSAHRLAGEVESSMAPRKSSTHASANEKEVFGRADYSMAAAAAAAAAAAPSQPSSVTSTSPEKGSPPRAEPSTPRRGRSLLASLPPLRGSNYAVEQAFIVSPVRSRSRSRASGSRMLIEVELRDSPGSEAQDGGQKMMFIRADVDDIAEEDEA